MATSAVAPRRLLCVAPLVPAGGVDTLLTAFGLLADDHPELSAEVVGSGPLARVLRAHADHLGLAERVCFRGRLAPPVGGSSLPASSAASASSLVACTAPSACSGGP